MKNKKKGAYRLQEKLTAAYLAAMLGIYLLYPGLGGYMTITTQKWHCYALLTLAYLASLLLLPLELAVVGEGSLVKPRALWQRLALPQKLIFAYWLCTAASTVLSIDRRTAFWGSGRCEGFLAITLYCGSFLLISVYAKPKKWMLWVFGAAMSLCCVLSLIQFTGYNPLGLYPEGMTYFDAYKRYAGEFLGTLGNVDLLAAVFSMAIPAFWVALLVLRDKRKYALLVPLCLCLYVLLRAFVAAGVVSVIGTALLVPPVLAKEKRQRNRLAALSLGLIAAGLLTVYFLGERVGSFAAEASALLHGQWDDSFGTGRLYIWRNVMPLVPERLLFGGGPDTLGLRLDAMFERFDPALGITIRSTIDAAHNEYLNILVNQGLLALLCHLAALFSAAVYWVRHASHDPVTAICGGAVLGYCIQAFFGLSSPITTPYLYLALALLMREVANTDNGRKKS